ncbi:hypothetical protein [Altererythrobacter sp. GH1-8]|uniref:hypothetical protein n=1 Tax=Altererythrobacter sp. GH1-8 TaxID=3349333 RepID=UPI00374CBCE7
MARKHRDHKTMSNPARHADPDSAKYGIFSLEHRLEAVSFTDDTASPIRKANILLRLASRPVLLSEAVEHSAN